MVSILSSDSVPDHLRHQLRLWNEAEWGAEVFPKAQHNGVMVPGPVVAVDCQKALLGGLTFTTAPRPDGSGTGVWINTLIVVPNHRGIGIATQLVSAAEAAANVVGVHQLFVLSDVPALYRKLGWQDVGPEPKDDEVILTKPI